MVKKIVNFVAKHKWAFMIGFAVIAVVCVVMGCDLGGDCGMALAMSTAVVPGTDDHGKTILNAPLSTDITREESENLLLRDVSKDVVKVRPQSTPLDAVTRRIKKQKSVSQITAYYSVGVMPKKSTISEVTKAGTATAAGTITVADSYYFEVNDTFIVPSVTGAKGGFLTLYVQKKTDEGDLVVLALNDANTAIATTLAGKEIVRIGFAGSEKDAQAPAMNALPDDKENYCQVFESQCEETEFQRLTDKEVEWEMTDIEEQCIYEMKRKIEDSLMFGVKSKIQDNIKKETIYTTDGMWWQAGSEFSYNESEDFDNKTLTALSQRVFAGNNGSKNRILFAGSDLIAKFQNLAYYERHIAASEEMTKFGVDFSVIVTKFGRLNIVHLELFDEVGMSGCGFVLDPTNAVRKEFKPFTRRELDLKKAGIRNTDAVFFQEVVCVNLMNPKTHCRITVEA
ncbi:MAG: DUF5309 family protein [Bacteroidaceae bacterium]|nr:DUF5309 family protein [Bacteroidaceae bacterium]